MVSEICAVTTGDRGSGEGTVEEMSLGRFLQNSQ